MPNRKLVALVAVPVIAVGAAGAWHLTKPGPDAPTPLPPATTASPPAVTATDTPAAPRGSVTASEPAGSAPSAQETLDDFLNPETEIVMGIEVRKDRKCTIQREYIERDDGTVDSAISCVPDPTPGKYDYYTDEELAVLAYDTADAAFELAMRLHNSDVRTAKQYVLRAVALDPGNISPIAWLAALHSERGTTPRARRAIARQYELTRVLEHFNPEQSATWIADDAIEAGLTNEDLSDLDIRAKQNLEFMRDVQLEVFGSTTIEEDEL